jgi:hypothetical protein
MIRMLGVARAHDGVAAEAQAHVRADDHGAEAAQGCDNLAESAAKWGEGWRVMVGG